MSYDDLDNGVMGATRSDKTGGFFDAPNLGSSDCDSDHARSSRTSSSSTRAISIPPLQPSGITATQFTKELVKSTQPNNVNAKGDTGKTNLVETKMNLDISVKVIKASERADGFAPDVSEVVESDPNSTINDPVTEPIARDEYSPKLDPTSSEPPSGETYRPRLEADSTPTTTFLPEISPEARTEAEVRQRAWELPQYLAWLIAAKTLQHWKSSFTIKTDDPNDPVFPIPPLDLTEE